VLASRASHASNDRVKTLHNYIAAAREQLEMHQGVKILLVANRTDCTAHTHTDLHACTECANAAWLVNFTPGGIRAKKPLRGRSLPDCEARIRPPSRRPRLHTSSHESSSSFRQAEPEMVDNAANEADDLVGIASRRRRPYASAVD
jgi:hypothetical protein